MLDQLNSQQETLHVSCPTRNEMARLSNLIKHEHTVRI